MADIPRSLALHMSFIVGWSGRCMPSLGTPPCLTRRAARIQPFIGFLSDPTATSPSPDYSQSTPPFYHPIRPYYTTILYYHAILPYHTTTRYYHRLLPFYYPTPLSTSPRLAGSDSADATDLGATVYALLRRRQCHGRCRGRAGRRGRRRGRWRGWRQGRRRG